MGRRRKTPKTPHRRDVQSPAGVPDQQEKEHKELIRALIYTIQHFFGAFPPSVL